MSKRLLIIYHRFLAGQLGLDFRKALNFIVELPYYIRTYQNFKKQFKGLMIAAPCLHNRHAAGGDCKSEYFLQDLIVAKCIYASKPKKHLDIGSRIDGFVAHVASFREISVLDVRPVTEIFPGISFLQADLTQHPFSLANHASFDSLSCLHALEHFGLGRYGDRIDVDGYITGFRNMVSMLGTGGVFYLSVPIGQERVEFNANRVFDPRTITDLAAANQLSFEKLTVICQREGSFATAERIFEVSAEQKNTMFKQLAAAPYNLGIFVFRKS